MQDKANTEWLIGPGPAAQESFWFVQIRSPGVLHFLPYRCPTVSILQFLHFRCGSLLRLSSDGKHHSLGCPGKRQNYKDLEIGFIADASQFSQDSTVME